MPRINGSNQEGFTLIELMIVLMIIAALMAMCLPNLTTYIQRSKQTSTVAAATSVGNACVPWLLNQGGSAILFGPVDCVVDYPQPLTRNDMEALLSPEYIKMIPEFDAWGYPWQATMQGAKLTYPGPDMSPEGMQKMMATWQRMMMPGKYHERLEYFVGDWATETTMHMGGTRRIPPTGSWFSSFGDDCNNMMLSVL